MGVFLLGMPLFYRIMEKELIRYLSDFLTPERFRLFEKVLQCRTNYLTVVVENIFNPHNISAVFRSCDCFGIQDIHIIDDNQNYEVNPEIALGAFKWLSIHKYSQGMGNSSQFVLNELKSKKYRIFATVPDHKAVAFSEIDVSKGPIALVFGNEKEGISESTRELADGLITIPMVGFTESLNISVAAAIMLQHFSSRIRKYLDKSVWELDNDYREQLLLNWMRKTIKKADLIEKAFNKKQK